MSDQNSPNSMSGAFFAVGMATAVAIVVGVGTWLIMQFLVGSPQSDAIGTGATVAMIVLVVGSIFGIFGRSRRTK